MKMIKAAAVQMSPVLYSREGTVDNPKGLSAPSPTG